MIEGMNMEAGMANIESPAEMKPVEKGLTTIMSDLGSLESLIGRLFDRMGPVLSQAVPRLDKDSVPMPSNGPAEGNSTFFSALGEVSGRIRSVNKRVDEMIGRMEI